MTPGKIVLLLVLLGLVTGFGAFSFQVYRYYQAIRSGKTNPFLEERLGSSLSHEVANSQVTATDLARLTASPEGTIGKPGSKLTIVEFLDFDCPYCRQSFAAVREMITKYQDQVYFVVRDFPLEDLHPRALPSALAARCAGAQGKFWPYHDKLYINQDNHSDDDLARYAREAGLDEATFTSCYQAKTYESTIQQNVQDGLQAGVQGTPTFFFNGTRIQGALDAPTLEYLIKWFLNPPANG